MINKSVLLRTRQTFKNEDLIDRRGVTIKYFMMVLFVFFFIYLFSYHFITLLLRILIFLSLPILLHYLTTITIIIVIVVVVVMVVICIYINQATLSLCIHCGLHNLCIILKTLPMCFLVFKEKKAMCSCLPITPLSLH